MSVKLQQYFSSQTFVLEEPTFHNIETMNGTLIKTWPSPDGWRGVTKNLDESYTLWDMDNHIAISTFGVCSEPTMIKRTFINSSGTRVRATVPFNGIDKKNKIVDFAITNNGKYAVIAYDGDECIVWDIEKNLAIVKIDHLSNPGQNPIALTPDSLTLITCEQRSFDRYFW